MVLHIEIKNSTHLLKYCIFTLDKLIKSVKVKRYTLIFYVKKSVFL